MNVLHRAHGLLLLLPLACAAEGIEDGDGGSCQGAKCDEADGTPECDVANRTGIGSGLADVLNHNDPFANAIFKKGDSCPTTYAAIVEKLNEFDGENCDTRTAAVSETAQVMGTPTNYRTVTTRECGSRGGHGMLFSMFGLTPNAGSLPGSVEVIAFDEEAGVFNYYDLAGGEWEFHGDSKMFVDGEGGRCEGCHNGGGLIMKELDAPWLHWEGDTTTPGADDLIDKHPDLGDITDGIEIEDIVREGNDAWLDTRVTHVLEQGDVQALLEPLFCTVEINIGSGSSSEDGAIFRIGASALYDTNLGFSGADMDDGVYREAIAKSGQVIQNRNGTALKDENGDTVVDTHFPFSFPERSSADAEYVDRLVSDGIIDEEFAKDVVSIDLTRPIFSDDRCKLLEFAPDLDKLAEDGKPVAGLAKQIADGFTANLEAAEADPSTPAGQLLRAMQEAESPHRDDTKAFVNACEARDQADFMADVLMVISQRRDRSRDLRVMEFAETLPHDDLNPSAGVRLHPLTCELTNEFVGHHDEPKPEPEGSCLNIAEVFYDVAGAGDNGREWIKIYNSCGDDQSLDGHSLAWGGKDFLVGGIDLEGTIGGKSCMIIGGPTSDETNGTPPIDIKETLSPNLQNSGAEADGVAIFNLVEDDVTTSSIPLDSVIFGEANTSGLPDSRGETPEPHVGDAPAGSSIIRVAADRWEISEAPIAAECPDF